MQKSPFPPKAIQDQIVADIEELKTRANDHIYSLFFSENCNAACFYDLGDHRYEPPIGDEVCSVVLVLISRGYSKGEISRALGVSDNCNRTLNRWEKGGNSPSVIPYGAWRLLCSYAGLTLDLMLKNKV